MCIMYFSQTEEKSEGSIKKVLDKSRDGDLKKNTMQPGACISTDQYVSSVPGHLPHTYGKEKAAEK